MARDPYQVLGVAKTAPAKEIKSAFRKLAKKYHPDQKPDDPRAKERFAEISQAYDIVGDEEKRKAFDRGEIDAEGKPRFADFGAGAGGHGPFGGFARGGPGGAHFEFRSSGPGGAGDIFSEIFGQAFGGGGARTREHFAGDPFAGQRQQHGAADGADLSATLDVSLEDIAAAAKVTAVFPGGRKLAIKLPAYVEDGQTIRLKGQGQPSPIGKPGDALIRIRFARHPRFRVEGRDLHVDLPVSLDDAVLGAKVPVETLTGRIAVSVPAWSGSDKVMRIKGRGLPAKGGGTGDLFVHVRIMLPEGGDSELEAFVRKRAG